MRRRRPSQPFPDALILAATLLAVLTSIVAFPARAAASPWPEIDLSSPVTGLSNPVDIASAGDGSGRLFIVQQNGRIRIVEGGALAPGSFLDLSSVVGCNGLHSIAFPPQFGSTGRLYVAYENTDCSLVLARYHVSADPDVADPGSGQVILTVPMAEFGVGGHAGAELAFGPNDGYLYVSIGDGSNDGDPGNLAQDPGSLLGKMLRIDVETGDPVTYVVPPSNPFVGAPGYRDEIWATGLRNPWRFSFDRANGDLYIGDVGQDQLEEIDYQPSSSAGGENYGWHIMEGSACFAAAVCDPTGLALPAAEYDHSLGCSVTGGVVARAPSLPDLDGIFVYGDWCSGRIWGLRQTGTGWESSLLKDTDLSIVSFGEGEDGGIWVADYAGGAIYRLTDHVIPVGDPVIAAAGDIACPTDTATATTCRQQYTSDILVSGGFDAVLPLGDNQYLSGALPDYQAYYDPTWGRVRNITYPTPGNNDYSTAGASGYFGYFGAAAGDPQKGYYSYDLGSWHIISLNSNCSDVGGCDAGSPQEQWLRADLALRSTACTLAYWHHPRFSSGTAHGSDARTQALWQALYDFHADVVLNGHEHNYERFAPQAPTGAADPANGIREFVVGTGGSGLYALGSPIANSVVRNSDTFGVLKLALHAASYDWQFLPEGGGNFTDTGSAACTDPYDFALNATPLTRTVSPGTGTTFAVAVEPSGGFSGPVSLSVSGLPSGASASFGPNPVTVSTPTSSSLSLTTSATTTPGSYDLTITAASGAISHSRTVTLVVGGGGCSTGLYQAEYFNNQTLSASPTLTRCEAAINYDWGTGGPGGGIGINNFSVRWTGNHSFAAGTYTFTARADDGIRLWVDGALIIDAWIDQAPTTYQATRTLTAGEHQVKVEYYEKTGGAVAQVGWASGGGCSTGSYQAEYFNNPTLSASPTLTRCEAAINDDWGTGGPGGGIGTDNFSVRWTGSHSFAAGTYTFTARADDGIRVWVDGALIIDAWMDQAPTTYQATRTLTAGEHQVKVEYYEKLGGAVAQVGWASGGGCSTGSYQAEYFNNPTLSASPTLTRCEAAINDDWGTGGPGGGIGTDNFSVRWTGSHSFAAGTYTFTARADDGIRVWVDGALVIDAWKDQAPTTYQATRTLTAGEHQVKVEYYEHLGGAVAQVGWASGGGCSTGSYQAEYFNNPTLSGSPTLTRCEGAINDDWGTGGPGGGIGTDNFSVRWTGSHSFAAGTYTFTARADDGIRVWVDGALVIDAWKDQAPTTYQATRTLTAGEHQVKVEYYEHLGGAVAQVGWASGGGCSTGSYQAEYFNNPTLSGSPTLTRCEGAINDDWGTGGPGGGIGTDNFSVRWTGSHSFAAGTYTFTARADDGIRVWVDGALVIDAWKDQAPTTYQATRTLTAGEHQVKVEYYEHLGGAVAQVGW